MRIGTKAEARPLAVAELGERYRRYRLADPAAEEAMARSLRQYGQLSPVVACWRDGRAELLDGFKRRAAAAQVGLADVERARGGGGRTFGQGGDLRPQQRGAVGPTSWRKPGSCRRWCVRTA